MDGHRYCYDYAYAWCRAVKKLRINDDGKKYFLKYFEKSIFKILFFRIFFGVFLFYIFKIFFQRYFVLYFENTFETILPITAPMCTRGQYVTWLQQQLVDIWIDCKQTLLTRQ